MGQCIHDVKVQQNKIFDIIRGRFVGYYIKRQTNKYAHTL